jgi:hypothetical protein
VSFTKVSVTTFLVGLISTVVGDIVTAFAIEAENKTTDKKLKRFKNEFIIFLYFLTVSNNPR